jgi:transposase, IS5 family
VIAARTEFGAKVSLSMVEGFAGIEHLNWEASNEGVLLKEHIISYYEKYGYYPKSIEADKIYRNRDNRNFCKENKIKLSGPSLGRPRKSVKKEKEKVGLRNPIEGKFGEGKRRYGMACIMVHLAETSKTTIGILVLVMNLEKGPRLLLDLFENLGFFRKIWAC